MGTHSHPIAQLKPPTGVVGPTGPIGHTGPVGHAGPPGRVRVKLDDETLDSLWVARGIMDEIARITNRPYYIVNHSFSRATPDDAEFTFAVSIVSSEDLNIADYQVCGEGACFFQVSIRIKSNAIRCETPTNVEFGVEMNDPDAAKKVAEFIALMSD
jgi:hypothetical protein